MGTNRGGDGASQSANNNFIFVGPKLSLRKQSHDNTRSKLMRQYYRKKRAEQHAARHQDPSRSPSTVSDDSSVETQSTSQTSVDSADNSQRQLVPHRKSRSGQHAVIPREQITPSPTASLNADPIQFMLGADQDTRSHFFRFLRTPAWTIERRSSHDRFVSFPLASILKYQIAIVGFAACSSRQMDNGTPSSLSIRSHNSMIQQLNTRLLDAKEHSAEIILTMLGVIASAWYGGDEAECLIHADGFKRFYRLYGPPKQDPDLLMMCVASSLRFNHLLLDPPLMTGGEYNFGTFINDLHIRSQPLPGSLCDTSSATYTDLIRYTNRLTGMLVSIHHQSQHMSTDQLRAERARSQQRLFSPDSTLYHLLRAPLLVSTKSLPWQTAYDIGHWPYAIIYHTLLQSEMVSLSKSKQEETYAAIVAEIESIRLPPDTRTALININWATLNLFKTEVDRTWDARQLQHVLIRLDIELIQTFLKLMFWHICLDGEAPDVSLDKIKAIPSEIAKTVLGDSLSERNRQWQVTDRILEETDAP